MPLDLVVKLEKEGGYVAGLPLGGVPLATLVSHLSEIKLLLIRKKPKDHGTSRIVEADLEQETDVVLVDDVLTTGSTVRDTLELFKKSGAPIKVVGVVCVVNRCEGCLDKVPGTDIPIYSVLSLEDLLNANRRPKFTRRATTNPLTRYLFGLMEGKRTNVCWSADVDSPEKLLEVFRQVAPHLAIIKLHFDAIPGLTRQHVAAIIHIAEQYQVMIMGDRKFADIGSTVKKQLACNLGTTAMQCCTVHTVAGPAAINVLDEHNISSVLVAQMSNAGSITDDEFFKSYYASATKSMASKNSTAVLGLVCQSRADCDAGDGFVYMTPGVHQDCSTDGHDQRYRDCNKAIAIQGNDVVIVGRGIHDVSNHLEAVKRYRKAAWEAHETGQVFDPFRIE